jgi:hypothetical protein
MIGMLMVVLWMLIPSVDQDDGDGVGNGGGGGG